jgi:hypothetical protein
MPSEEQVSKVDIRQYRDDWYRFVVHKLVYGCSDSADLLKNAVHFITFNYDASLEFHLLRALMAIDLLDPNDIMQFLSSSGDADSFAPVIFPLRTLAAYRLES